MENLEQIKLLLSNSDPEVRINALFDAWEYQEEGIKLIIKTLDDKARKVRQTSLLLLIESKTKIAKQALWNYSLFSKIECLNTIDNFNFDSFETNEYHPDYFAIANFNNSLVAYWDITYKSSGVAIWDLETGNLKKDYDLTAHEFGLGKNGKVFISAYQDIIMPPQDIETQKFPHDCLEGIVKMRGIDGMGFAVSKTYGSPRLSMINY